MEYLHGLYTYRDMADNNGNWNKEPASHHIFNININNDNHISNASVLLLKWKIISWDPFHARLKEEEVGKDALIFK